METARKKVPPRGRKIGEALIVRVPPDQEHVLRGMAEDQDRPLASVLREAIRHYLACEHEAAQEARAN